MSANPPAAVEVPRRFAPRRVAKDELANLLQEGFALFGAAPLRLSGLYLLVYVPLLFVLDLPYVGRPLDAAIGGIAFAGFFTALESVRQHRQATLHDMGSAWKLPADKLVLLAAGGLVPVVFILLAWWLDLGSGPLDALLSGEGTPLASPLRTESEGVAVGELVSMPLLFLQPACVLFPWSGTRTLSATLILWLANWRWALGIALVRIPLSMVLIILGMSDPSDPGSSGGLVESIAFLAFGAALDLATGVFTLVLLNRSLR